MSYSEREELVLQILSFYTPLSVAQIIMSFDDETLKNHPQFSQEDLEQILYSFYKKGMVKKSKIKGQTFWKRTHPPRVWYKKWWLKITTLF